MVRLRRNAAVQSPRAPGEQVGLAEPQAEEKANGVKASCDFMEDVVSTGTCV